VTTGPAPRKIPARAEEIAFAGSAGPQTQQLRDAAAILLIFKAAR